MATPYDLYVRFLVTKGVDDLRAAQRATAALNLPEVPAAVFEAQQLLVETQVPPGVYRQIETRFYSVDFLPWMKALEVEELWHGEAVAFLPPAKDDKVRHTLKLVYDIHQDLQLRLTVDGLLIKGVPPQEVAQAVNGRYAALLREQHIVLYERCFFAARRMTRGDWRRYLPMVSDEAQRIYFTALSEPVDTLKAELELPAKHSTTETLQHLLSRATIRARRLLDDETPEGRAEARQWIDTVLKLTSSYERYRSGDQGDFAKHLQMEFDFVSTDFATPDPDVLQELANKKRKATDEPKSPDEAAVESEPKT